jgi:hypothetical protein
MIGIQPKMVDPYPDPSVSNEYNPKNPGTIYIFNYYYLWLLVFFGSELQLLLASVWSSLPPTTSTLTAAQQLSKP